MKPTLADAEAWLDFYGIGGATLADKLDTFRAIPNRCGTPDSVQVLGQRQCQWPEKRVSWYVEPNVYTRFPVWAMAWGPALKSWEDVCGIEFFEVETKETANIYVTAGRIDVSGMTLAWSHLPCGFTMRDQATQRYDTADAGGVFAAALTTQEVAAHEVGHAIGIGHLARGNLMQPFAAGNIITPKTGDISEAVARYGPPRGRPTPVPTPTPTPIPTPKPPPMDWLNFDWDSLDWSRLNR